MTKNVIIRIEGSQKNSDEEPVVINEKGIYQQRENAHYVRYEEASSEDPSQSIKAMIKITPERIILSKQGIYPSQMVFDRMEMTQTCYQTPYGALQLEIRTKDIILKEEADLIHITLEYCLSENGSHLSDNRTIISISSVQ
ncbi:DUF1934 domain-containing protein [Lachnospiraceae bacterium MD1]|jgi:uncharacterized beta-barrel protein YwiB (DUF1934 family)|uniref:DUF1934 domain-containing protein n=1 Tax=Variimorphobacter saccharofermentans TaxID=2755051 RepID=A0A839JWH4_9FIRM|nr:DUF1934 domain-containing protein [Variimorphobacter saccharofermentans]MBB2181352.1 DUF1934 domain-containing protein [Variimorphobacter saccharofermentans]